MGRRVFVIISLLFLLFGLFLTSSSNVTISKRIETKRTLDQQTKSRHETKPNISNVQKDITTPTITTKGPTTPTQTEPILNPDSTSSPMITPSATSTSKTAPGASWCVASESTPSKALQVALDYACGYGGADCSSIQSGGSCFEPNTVRDHASYAFNAYYQKNPIPNSCNFGGSAVSTNTDPSTGTCHFPSISTSTSILNTTNSDGAIVFGVVPSSPLPSTATAINSTAISMFLVPFLILNLLDKTSILHKNFNHITNFVFCE